MYALRCRNGGERSEEEQLKPKSKICVAAPRLKSTERMGEAQEFIATATRERK